MRPEYYSDQFRRYATYVRNYSDNEVYKVACGANSSDYNWTEVVMREIGSHMDGLSLHYYTMPGSRDAQGTAIDFDEDLWNLTMQKALFMDELIVKTTTIMDRYDPDKKIDLIIDEWGTWFGVEIGTNPKFLYQQNTLRDALVSGIHLNIFNNHCDRVKMANIAQTVNVLQAMILTDEDKMVLTPTYHVFNMFKVHQNAKLLDICLSSSSPSGSNESENALLSFINASASVDSENNIHVSLCNLSPTQSIDLKIELRGRQCLNVKGKILTAEKMNTHNTFENPNAINPVEFKGATLNHDILSVKLPAMSVTVLEID